MLSKIKRNTIAQQYLLINLDFDRFGYIVIYYIENRSPRMNFKILTMLPLAAALSACGSLSSYDMSEHAGKIDSSLCVSENTENPTLYSLHYKLSDRSGIVQSGKILEPMVFDHEESSAGLMSSKVNEAYVSEILATEKDGVTTYKSIIDSVDYGVTLMVEPKEEGLFEVKMHHSSLKEMKKLEVAGGYIESPKLEDNELTKTVGFSE